MKLHYSQTSYCLQYQQVRVLLPYEITLFSNGAAAHWTADAVLLPYEITLFSNQQQRIYLTTYVLLPYEITLFSNNFSKEA